MCVYIYIMIYIYVLYGFIMIYIDCIVDVVGQMHTSHSQGPVPQAHQASHSPTFTTHNGDTTWNQSWWIDRSLNHRLEPWSKASCRSLALKFMPTLWRARHFLLLQLPKVWICLSLIIKWYTIWLHLNIDKFILFVYIKWPYINRKSGDLMYFFGAVGIKPLKTVEDCHHPSWSGSTLVLHWAAYPIVGEDQSARLGFGPYPCVEKHLNFSQRSRSLVNSSCGVGIFPEQVLPSGSAISGYWNSQTSWPFSTLDSIVKLPRRDTWLPVLPADAEARRASPEAQMPNSPRIRCWQHLAMVKSVFAIFLYLGASVYIYIYTLYVCVCVCKYI